MVEELHRCCCSAVDVKLNSRASVFGAFMSKLMVIFGHKFTKALNHSLEALCAIMIYETINIFNSENSESVVQIWKTQFALWTIKRQLLPQGLMIIH